VLHGVSPLAGYNCVIVHIFSIVLQSPTSRGLQYSQNSVCVEFLSPQYWVCVSAVFNLSADSEYW
jgi:hypothetical protein